MNTTTDTNDDSIYPLLASAHRIADTLAAIPAHRGDAADLYALAEFFERMCAQIEQRKSGEAPSSGN